MRPRRTTWRWPGLAGVLLATLAHCQSDRASIVWAAGQATPDAGAFDASTTLSDLSTAPSDARVKTSDASAAADVVVLPTGALVERGAAAFGSFIPRVSGRSGEYYGAASTDLNADGRPDVLAWSDTGWVLLMQGADGSFTPATLPSLEMNNDVAPRCAGFGDLDGDGAPDAVFARQQVTFLRNEGGHLVDRSSLALSGQAQSFQGGYFGITFADLDLDGLLDVAVAQMSCGSGPNRVFRNEGDFHFVDVASELGLALPDGAAFSLAVDAVADDGILHVWNFPEGCVEMRMRHRRFRPGVGADLPALMDDRPTDADWADPMGSALLDVDGDGHLDLYLSAGGRNAVLVGPEYTTSLYDARGLASQPGFNPTSAWSAVLLDADLDGAPDLYVTSSPSTPSGTAEGITDGLYLHGTDGRFHNVADRLGVTGDHDCQAAFGVDLDRDGDTDLLAGCSVGLRLLRNDLVSQSLGRTVVLRGSVSNPDGVNAILVGPSGERRVQRGGGQPYAGGVVRESLRAAGGQVTVLWPSGIRQTVDAGASPVLTVVEPAALQVSPRRVAVGARTPVAVVVDPGALGTPMAAVHAELTGGAWSTPLARGDDGRWRGTIVPPAERATVAVTVTVGELTLRVRPRIFVR